MAKQISLLKDKHVGQDIWIILAGPTMDFIDPSFFDNKIVIAQNQAYRHFPATYVCMKDCNESPRFTESLKELEELGLPVIYSEYYRGGKSYGKNKVNLKNSYMFKHNPRKGRDLSKEIAELKDEHFIASKSTVTSLMHLAAYMGAKNIILCGHDCGTINDKLYYDNYVEKDWKSAGNWSGIKNWMGKIEAQTVMVRKYLQDKYNCNIYSLNPFLNFGLEGNKYKKSQ